MRLIDRSLMESLFHSWTASSDPGSLTDPFMDCLIDSLRIDSLIDHLCFRLMAPSTCPLPLSRIPAPAPLPLVPTPLPHSVSLPSPHWWGNYGSLMEPEPAAEGMEMVGLAMAGVVRVDDSGVVEAADAGAVGGNPGAVRAEVSAVVEAAETGAVGGNPASACGWEGDTGGNGGVDRSGGLGHGRGGRRGGLHLWHGTAQPHPASYGSVLVKCSVHAPPAFI